MKVVLAEAAKQDVGKIFEYISETLKNVSAAKKTVQKILHGCGILKEQPHIGLSVQQRLGFDLELSYVVIGKYLAFYHVVGQRVIVVRIIDSRMDYMRRLKDLL